MKLHIILAALLFFACDWTNTETEDVAPVEPDVAPVVVEEVPEPGPVVAPILDPPPAPMESQILKPLTQQEVFELGNATDDITKYVAEQSKAFRRWKAKSKDAVAVRKAVEKRSVLLHQYAKERKRKVECLVILLGQQVPNAEAIAKQCGTAQWAMDVNGRIAGGK